MIAGMKTTQGSLFKRCGCGDRSSRAAPCLLLGRRGHGSWYAARELAAGPDGHRCRLRRGGYPTRAAARAALQSWHNPARPVLTVGQWLTRWLASRAHLRASTLRAYESHVRLYLLPHLGGIPLADLQADDVAAQRRALVERNAASDLELSPGRRPHPVVWTEPRVRAWRAGGTRPPVAVWTAEQTAVFLHGVDTGPLGRLFRLIALRGLRRGEACGLFWSDLDTAADGTTTLTIGRQLVEVRGAPSLTEPKSAASCRTIALDADTAARLADRRRHTRAPGGPMFTTATGRALRPGTVTHRFARLVAAADLPPVRLHDLRRGAATLALAAGADLKIIQDLLGHASIVPTPPPVAQCAWPKPAPGGTTPNSPALPALPTSRPSSTAWRPASPTPTIAPNPKPPHAPNSQPTANPSPDSPSPDAPHDSSTRHRRPVARLPKRPCEPDWT